MRSKYRQIRRGLELKAEQDLVFVKLGGSAITHKDTPNKANTKIIEQVSKEISNVYSEYKLLIGNGGGSFPHPVAAKYKVQEGLKVCGPEGFVQTQRAARELNQIVTNSLIKNNVPAVSIQPSACAVANKGEIEDMYMHSIQTLMHSGMVPVVYGDVMVDNTKGCTIASTEMILAYLAKKLSPKRIIIGTDVDGVFTRDPKSGDATLVKEINQDNIQEVLSMATGSKNEDVTGGMAHKIQELYNLSKLNIGIELINLLKPGLLEKAIKGETGLGTTIKIGSQ